MAIQHIATALFAVGILHTFLAGKFKALGNRYPEGSVKENLFHLLGETEVVFGLWSAVLFVVMAGKYGWHEAVQYAEERKNTEALFVFAIMSVAASKPILIGAQGFVEVIARWFIQAITKTTGYRIKPDIGFFFMALYIGPLLGSFITEPGAMTIVASLLAKRYYERGMSRRFMYSTLAVLLLNVGIGGCLTSFAAPPVLMIAEKWGWDTVYMLKEFGWRAILACGVNALALTVLNAKEISLSKPVDECIKDEGSLPVPPILVLLHLAFMGMIVVSAHHPTIFMAILLFFIGLVAVTKEYQSELKIKEAMLVGFFLGGLVFLGGLQEWWLQPLLSKLSSSTLYFSATGLTGITDNAMLTYLASLVKGLSAESKRAVVAGALSGSALTIIANAPNPAALAILKDFFENLKEGKEFSSLGLFVAALPPTAVVIFVFWII